MATHENLSKKKEKRENPYQTIYRNKLFFLENWPRFPYFSPSESMRKHDSMTTTADVTYYFVWNS